MLAKEFEDLEEETDLDIIEYHKNSLINQGIIYVVDNYQLTIPSKLNVLKTPIFYQINFIKKTLKYQNEVDTFNDITAFSVRQDDVGLHFRITFSILKENSTDIDSSRMCIITFSYKFLYTNHAESRLLCFTTYSQVLDYYKEQLEHSKSLIELEIQSLHKLKNEIL